MIICRSSSELPWWLSGKEFACQCRRHGFSPWVGTIPRRRKRHPTPVFLPGESHGQRSLAGCMQFMRLKRQDRGHRLTCGISYLSLKREASPNRMDYSVGLKFHRHYHPSGGFCLTQRHKSKKFVHELLYFASCMSKVAGLLIIFLQCILIHM